MATQSSTAHINGNGSNGSSVDARRLTIPLWLALSMAGFFAVTCSSLIAGFFQVSSQIEQLVAKIDNSVSHSNFETFCLRAQLENKGWTCPGYRSTETEAVKTPARPHVRLKAAKAKPKCSPFESILGQC